VSKGRDGTKFEGTGGIGVGFGFNVSMGRSMGMDLAKAFHCWYDDVTKHEHHLLVNILEHLHNVPQLASIPFGWIFMAALHIYL
jgi:hypothetical protein